MKYAIIMIIYSGHCRVTHRDVAPGKHVVGSLRQVDLAPHPVVHVDAVVVVDAVNESPGIGSHVLAALDPSQCSDLGGHGESA